MLQFFSFVFLHSSYPHSGCLFGDFRVGGLEREGVGVFFADFRVQLCFVGLGYRELSAGCWF